MKIISELASDLLSLLFPVVCQTCGDTLVRNERIICTGCNIEIPRTGFHREKDNYIEKLFWGRCHLERAAVFAAYVKRGKMARLIYRFKYNGIRAIGFELGKMYGADLMSSGFLDGIDLLVPVPLHRRRLRKRGFNQSEVIAHGISAVCGLPVVTGNLVRTQGTETQTVRSRIARWENVEGAVTLRDIEEFGGKHLLLVDDVITTGSTIDACVSVLSEAQEVKVSVVALAAAIV